MSGAQISFVESATPIERMNQRVAAKNEKLMLDKVATATGCESHATIKAVAAALGTQESAYDPRALAASAPDYFDARPPSRDAPESFSWRAWLATYGVYLPDLFDNAEPPTV